MAPEISPRTPRCHRVWATHTACLGWGGWVVVVGVDARTTRNTERSSKNLRCKLHGSRNRLTAISGPQSLPLSTHRNSPVYHVGCLHAPPLPPGCSSTRNSHLRSPTLDHAQLGRRQPQSDKCSPLEAAVSCDPEVKGGHCCSTTDCCSTAANDVRTTRRPPRVQGRCLAYDSSAHSRPCRRRDLGRSPVSPLPASRDRSPRIPVATTASARAGTDAQSTLAATPSGLSRLQSPSATASASAPTC